MAQKRKNRIIIPCRFAYFNCWRPSSIYGNNKYSMSAIISKDDTETLDSIYEAIEYVKEKSMTKWGGRIPSNLKSPLHDGDEEKPENPNYRNCFYLNAKCNDQPQIVDRKVRPITDPTEVYSGCYGNISLIFYGYNCSGNKGIGVWLGNIQKTKDGTPIGGRITAKDEFLPVKDSEDAEGSYYGYNE